jgi:hypothetical protein
MLISRGYGVSFQKFLPTLKTPQPPLYLAYKLSAQLNFKLLMLSPIFLAILSIISFLVALMHDISTRAVVVALKSPLGGKTTTEIAGITGLSKRTINSIYARAIERGFDPNIVPLLMKDKYLEDAP